MKFIDPESLPYYHKLYNLREFLAEEMQGFPEWRCNITSRIVRMLTGLELRAGEYTPCMNLHMWNFDPNRKVNVDLTMNQFDVQTGLITPKIAVLEEDTYVLSILKNVNEEVKNSMKSYGNQEKRAEQFYNKFLSR